MTQSKTQRRFWQEPLVHFLIIGALVFAIHGLWQARMDNAERTIVVSQQQLQRLTAIWASEAGREPTPEDVKGLLAEYVKEEALYREAQRLGLDRDDTIIRRRLAQKMSFLLESAQPETQLEESDLRTAYERDPSVYARPARLTFRHVPFNEDTGDADRSAEIADVLVKLQEDADADPTGLGDPFMLSRIHADLTEVQLARLFGPDFAKVLFETEQEEWFGPVASRLAVHLVHVDRRVPGGIPAFNDVIEEVRTREESMRRQTANDEALARVLERYTIVLDDAPA